MEVFSRILDKSIRATPNFKYHWRCRKNRLSHLCFADDLMIFCKGDLDSIKVVKGAIQAFSTWSGLLPNPMKSSIFLSGVNDQEQSGIASLLGFSLGSLPIRYLGVPLISTKLKAHDCRELEDRILKRIKVWTNRFLSFAGRLQLIQSVLFSIQAYWCYHFILPSKVSKSIESILSAFLWTGVSLGRHGAKVSWEEVSRPKQEGGLGIRKIKDWNMAAISRYIWLICQPTSSSLWVSWVKINLLNKNHFWVAKVPWNCSWTWRKVLNLRSKLQDFITVDIGDGSQTSLWFDSWMPRGPICASPNARVIYDSGLSKDAKVSAIISSNDWKWPLANSFELIDLKEETLALDPPNCNGRDKVVWNKTKGRDFSIKAAWHIIRSQFPRVEWSHLVWFKYQIPRHSFMLWIAIRKRLATQDRLCSFGSSQHTDCHLCGDGMESHDHLFFNCIFSTRIWHIILGKLGLNAIPTSWSTTIQWACTTYKGSSLLSFIGRLSLAAAVHTLWGERNSRLHGKPPRNELTIANTIMDLVRLRLMGCKGFPRNPINTHLVHHWQLASTLLD